MSLRIQKILLPTDFSAYSATATKYACELADKFAASLFLLHVVETHPTVAPDFGMGLALPAFVNESTTAAEKALANLLDPQWAAHHSIVQAVVQGSPKAEIVRYARQSDIDLIVLTTHGRTGLAHVLLGSVAETIVRTAPCPVLTVRPEGHQFVMP